MDIEYDPGQVAIAELFVQFEAEETAIKSMLEAAHNGVKFEDLGTILDYIPDDKKEFKYSEPDYSFVPEKTEYFFFYNDGDINYIKSYKVESTIQRDYADKNLPVKIVTWDSSENLLDDLLKKYCNPFVLYSAGFTMEDIVGSDVIRDIGN